MRRLMIAAAMAFGLASPAAFGQDAPGGLDLPLQGVITNPDWAQIPTGEDMARYYPPLAQYLALTGRVVISCTVTSAGALSDCAVEKEAPSGIGFADAALKLSSLFKMRPMTLDKTPVGGASVRIPINFALGVPAPPKETKSPELSEHSLQLARQVLSAAHIPEDLAAQDERWLAQMKNVVERFTSNEPDGQRTEQAILDARRQSLVAIRPQLLEGVTKAYAEVYSDSELASLAEMLRTPIGQLWIVRREKINALNAAVETQGQLRGQAEFVRLLCQRLACPPPAPAEAPSAASAGR